MDGETTQGGGQGGVQDGVQDGGQGSGRAADEDKLWTNDLSEVLTGDITTCRDVAHRQRSSPRREGSFFRSAVERLMSRFNFDFFKIRCAMLADRAYEIRRQFLTVIDIATDTASPDCLCLLAGRRCLLLWLDMLLIKSIGR